MGRPRKNEDIGKPWVVRDVPEDVKRKVRVYAAQHDMTMAQAVEAMIEGRYGSQEDRELLQALIKVYGRVIAEDMPGAQVEAEQVTGILEKQRLEGRLDQALALPPPISDSPSTPSVTEFTSEEITERFVQAFYFDKDFKLAAQLLSPLHPLRRGHTLEETASALLHDWALLGGEQGLFVRKAKIYEDPYQAYTPSRIKMRYTATRTFEPDEWLIFILQTFHLSREKTSWYITHIGEREEVTDFKLKNRFFEEDGLKMGIMRTTIKRVLSVEQRGELWITAIEDDNGTVFVGYGNDHQAGEQIMVFINDHFNTRWFERAKVIE